MEYKSNITIKSNIYNRSTTDIKQDPDFVHSCRGGVALRKLQKQLYGFSVTVKLTPAQKQLASDDKGCSKAKDEQMTHDPITGQCHCEYTDCKYFHSCMPIPIEREIDIISDDAMKTEILEYKWLGTIEHIFDEPEIPELEQEEFIPEEFIELPEFAISSFTALENADSIVNAPIDSHILVNAGPGTGKTHTVIERLTRIINSGEVNLSEVWVLCYTTAARDVILERLSEKGLYVESQQLVICTFDSLAWNNLSQKTDDNLFDLGFDGCIKRFNIKFDENEMSNIEYVIIDEIQDFVGERAKMALNIVKALRCGYLLLGDRCQAIYDYDSDSIDSVVFYNRLNELLPETAAKYELFGNRRQSTELSQRSDCFRKALLELEIIDTNNFFKEQIQLIQGESFSADIFANLPQRQTTAILTRDNGEAEWVSALLHKANITHHLLRPAVMSRATLNRWIADMFWDYIEPRISRENFIVRYQYRVKNDRQSAENAYDDIIKLLSNNYNNFTEFFTLEKLHLELQKQFDIPLGLTNVPCENLTVSTIHKAKGREFDHVFLFDSFSPRDEHTQEARVWYVGVTRPKTDLTCLHKKNWYLRKPKLCKPVTIRWIKYKFYRSYNKVDTCCERIVVGLNDDVDINSFINNNLEESLAIQEYIAHKVKSNDLVELHLINGVYEIRHNGFYIGRLSEKAMSNITASIKDLYPWSGIPLNLSEIYVSNIITVTFKNSLGGINSMFKDSKFWLGIELSGFAKVGKGWI